MIKCFHYPCSVLISFIYWDHKISMCKYKLNSNNETFIVIECTGLGKSEGNWSKGGMMPSYTGGFRDLMSMLMSDGEKQTILQNI